MIDENILSQAEIEILNNALFQATFKRYRSWIGLELKPVTNCNIPEGKIYYFDRNE